MTDILLNASGVTKRFPGVIALDNVEFDLRQGEILAIIGENGAGKSTLMKILAGIQRADLGSIELDGTPVQFDNVAQAAEAGVVLIHQELNICTNLDVGANVFLGREPTRMGLINREQIRSQTAEVLQAIGLEVDPTAPAADLTIGQQQMVEIAKAIATRSRVIIMDEPTSSLSQHETQSLFRIIRDLQRDGVSIIYISHRLREVQELADRVIVLRDGKNAGELVGDEINHPNMITHMVGRDLTNLYPRRSDDSNQQKPGDMLLRVEDLATFQFPDCRVSFEIRVGEIVGLAGLVGAGRTELLTTLFGITPAISGKTEVAGQPVNIRNCQTAIRHQMALVPEDRKAQGVILEMAIRENISLARIDRDSKLGMVHFGREQNLAADMQQRLSIKTPSTDQRVGLLSGGNQQKVVIAKWLALQPQLLLLDEPTRGVDVGARQEIYALMNEMAEQGAAILFVSSDMEEVLGMSDRMMVMHEGRISGQLDRAEFSEEAVMSYATGLITNV